MEQNSHEQPIGERTQQARDQRDSNDMKHQHLPHFGNAGSAMQVYHEIWGGLNGNHGATRGRRSLSLTVLRLSPASLDRDGRLHLGMDGADILVDAGEANLNE